MLVANSGPFSVTKITESTQVILRKRMSLEYILIIFATPRHE